MDFKMDPEGPVSPQLHCLQGLGLQTKRAAGVGNAKVRGHDSAWISETGERKNQ